MACAGLVVDHPFPRRDDGLGHVVAGQDVLPDPLRQLVAAVGRAAAVACHRLEEQAAARVPQALRIGRVDDLGARHMLQQDLLRGLRNAQCLQSRGIAEQCEVALVGVQRVGLRMRCQHDRALQIRLAQRGAAGLVQVEVGQPVVDQVDGQVAVPQRAAAPFERGRVGDDRSQAMPLEQLLEQQELGVEVLVLGCRVDDGDARQRPRIPPSRTDASRGETSRRCACSNAATMANVGTIRSTAVQQARWARASTALSIAPPALVLISISPK